ncbi:DUF3999 domain-containing protein [Pseudolysobacter antarcticus]|uniref:DUF3999 domain-containing protein n=1 Tax=Pseudolysobacter antarcticus TaxID=2511995 RepID=A0A411HFF4_9GAMM|nr:DUF3999 domain-containing protein [Pseudolysobacter antarcticus]QBB69215.1 DUF3999 domain-containing protein [Pseudolysobacter antarcticus]
MKLFALNRTTLVGVVFAVFCADAMAAKSSDFAYAWPLTTGAESSAYQIEITPEVYAALFDPELRDLEVFNAADEAVPLQAVAFDTQVLYHEERVKLPSFALPRNADDQASDDLHIQIERDITGRLRKLDTQTGNARAASTRTDYLLDASAIDAPIESLWLQDTNSTSALNAQFAVDASDDLQHWHTLVDAASVMDLRQNDATLVRRQIVLAQAHAKYLRLRRLDNGTTPGTGFSVEARLLSRTSVQRPGRQWIDVPLSAQDAPSTIAPASAGHNPPPIGYQYLLPGALNVEALRVTLASDNSIAEMSALSRLGGGATQSWSQRARFTAFRLRQDGAVLSNDEIAIGSGLRSREWRIEPAQALSVPASLSIAYRPDRFVFLAQAPGPYRLVAGQRSERRGDAPVNAALMQLRARLGHDWQPPLVTLGARETLRGAAATAAPAPTPEAYPWKSWLLWTLLVGGAAAVGFMALQLLKDAQPPKP